MNLSSDKIILLKKWADLYEQPTFIVKDPIQFPHRYRLKQDIEICGLLTAYISFGNRTMICRKAEELQQIMAHHPLAYIRSKQWITDFPDGCTQSFYRTISKGQMHLLFQKLHESYATYDSLEDALIPLSGSPRERLCRWMGVSEKSPQKKLNMFLRWMIRPNSCVDFGIWKQFQAKDLIIPLDTHVCRIAAEIGLSSNTSYSLKQALQITGQLDKIFPGDPCKGDFALFGYGISHPQG